MKLFASAMHQKAPATALFSFASNLGNALHDAFPPAAALEASAEALFVPTDAEKMVSERLSKRLAAQIPQIAVVIAPEKP